MSFCFIGVWPQHIYIFIPGILPNESFPCLLFQKTMFDGNTGKGKGNDKLYVTLVDLFSKDG